MHRPVFVLLALWLFALNSNANVLALSAPKSNTFSALSPSQSPSSAVNVLSSGNTDFLPVTEAYRLHAEWSVDKPSTLLLLWDIAPGYYLYRHQVSVTLDDETLYIEMPQGKEHYDEYLEREIAVFYDSLPVTVNIPNSTKKPFQLQVRSQGCADAGLCYPPQVDLVSVGQDRALTIDTPVAVTPSFTVAQQSSANTPNTSSSSWAYYLFAIISALLGGVLLNLMPCVFPVLSLKALSLVRGQAKPHSQHLHGWAYTAGTVSTFTLIAALLLILRASGQAIGWGFQLQNPVFVALLVYLFFIMALNFLGFWQLSGRYSDLGQSLTEGNHYRHSFFTGALATLVASPCTAPFMGSALGYAVTQPPVIALSVFAALGFGMAAPYLLLTYLPALSRKLPKPGAWMETLKHFMAFPLLLTAIWLLWVVGRQTSVDGLALLLSGVLSLTIGIWLWQHQPQRVWQKIVALALLLAALWPLPALNTLSTSASGLASQQASSRGNQWQPFTPARLDQLQRSGTPVFVNLTADWCITCLANEKIALNTERTAAAFRQAGVVLLKGDWTHYNPEITELLAQFNRNGVPLYLLYSGKANAMPQILPQILSEKTVLASLQELNHAR